MYNIKTIERKPTEWPSYKIPSRGEQTRETATGSSRLRDFWVAVGTQGLSVYLFSSSSLRSSPDWRKGAGFWLLGFLQGATSQSPMSSSAMLGRWFVSPSLADEAGGHGSLNSLGVPKSSPNLTMKEDLACRARHRFRRDVSEKRSHRYDSLESRKWRLHSTDQTQSLLIEDEEKTWEECKQLVSSLNFTTEEADAMLGKAFGWVHSPYWGEERKKEIPKDVGLNQMLDYLRNLGLSDDDLHKLLKKFPEVLGCSLDDEVKINVGVLEREWGIKGKTLRSLLLRNPKVLGYNVDCKGDCIAQCTRCWARF
ncbi:hypothetical protein Taro_020870 [Colocasia esculenta]|uniref:Mitochondrial transcription termination factor family protein n=1 Tax=Colocasia esculenta TaxID=4460 RepID=A0A843UZV2_COLES|nr:hypothetical protein [Colocasia esculenta]